MDKSKVDGKASSCEDVLDDCVKASNIVTLQVKILSSVLSESKEFRKLRTFSTSNVKQYLDWSILLLKKQLIYGRFPTGKGQTESW